VPRSRLANGPSEDVLFVHLSLDDIQQAGLRRALSTLGRYAEVQNAALRHRGGEALAEGAVLQAAAEHRPSLVVLQVLRQGNIRPGFVRRLREVLPGTALVVTWNVDVMRLDERCLDKWAVDVSREVDLTLVSNASDPERYVAAGAPAAGYLPVGYDPEVWWPAPAGSEGAVFVGRNYEELDGGYRRALFEEVRAELPGVLALYGTGWGGGLGAYGPVDEARCAAIYRAAGIVVCTSLFPGLRRYTSNRLPQAMGVGACVACRAFDDCEGLGLRDGSNVLLWRDARDLVALLSEWLRSEAHERRVAVGAAAASLASRDLTWGAWSEGLLSVMRAERLARAAEPPG